MTSDFAATMNKKFGKKVMWQASDPRFEIKFIPTGVLPLDILMHGGVPIGFWTEIYGDEAVLKTAIGLWTIANAQKMGMKALIIDPEDTITKDVLELRGVDTSPSMLDIVSEFDNAEEALDILKLSMQGKHHGIALIDSISALLPAREADGDMAKLDVGSQAKMMSKVGRVHTTANKRHMPIICINQTRQKIGISFGDPTTRSGGKALGFYDSQLIRLIAIHREKTGKDDRDGRAKRGNQHIVSMDIAALLQKSKVGGHNGDETTFTYDVVKNRIDESADIVAQGQVYGIFTKKGNSLVYKGTQHFKKDWISILDRKPKMAAKIKARILKKAIADG